MVLLSYFDKVHESGNLVFIITNTFHIIELDNMTKEKAFFIVIFVKESPGLVRKLVVYEISCNRKKLLTRLQIAVDNVNLKELENTIVQHFDTIEGFFFTIR